MRARTLKKPTVFLIAMLMWNTLATAGDDGMTMHLRPARPAKKAEPKNSVKNRIAAGKAKPSSKVALAEKLPQKPEKLSAKTVALRAPVSIPSPSAILKVELAAVTGPETALAETTGVVVERNWVLVPFDVIAAVGLHRGEPAFFVGPHRVHATLADFDLVSNQALLKTDSLLPDSLPLSLIRSQGPRVDEVIVAAQGVGGVKFSGKIHDVTNDGIVNRFNVPSPFVAQNVESFAFDANGSLVGVRSRGQDEYSPSTYTHILLMKALGKQPASTQSMLVKLHQQWVELQTKWAESLIQDPTRLRMQQWQVGLGTKILKCQPLRTRIADRNLASVVDRAEGQTCVNRASTKIDADYQPGVETVSGVGNFNGTVDGEKWKSLTHEMALSLFSPFDSDIQSVSLFTAPVCEESSGVSKSGQELRVHFCTSSIKGEAGLNDSVVFVTTRQPAGDGFAFSGVRLKGFDQTNSKSLVWAIMESFKRSK